MDQEMKRPMTEAEKRRYKADIPRETITEERVVVRLFIDTQKQISGPPLYPY
jgi:hypothetical protein